MASFGAAHGLSAAGSGRYLVDPTILQPVKLSCTALYNELFSNITKHGLHRRCSSLRKPVVELLGQLDGACHGVNMSAAI